ncbi:MAG TPA: hypothetical protein VFA05_03675 [Gaiellaceae bacterium]|nr:hypothetical protein [Gaiellaceae bacterium]
MSARLLLRGVVSGHGAPDNNVALGGSDPDEIERLAAASGAGKEPE